LLRAKGAKQMDWNNDHECFADYQLIAPEIDKLLKNDKEFTDLFDF
jgi:hypothetical protein